MGLGLGLACRLTMRMGVSGPSAPPLGGEGIFTWRPALASLPFKRTRSIVISSYRAGFDGALSPRRLYSGPVRTLNAVASPCRQNSGGHPPASAPAGGLGLG